MGIEEDYHEIIKKNFDYLRSTLLTSIKNYGKAYKIRLIRKVKELAFDFDDYEEVKLHLKNIHKEIIEEKIHTPHGEIEAPIFQWITYVNSELVASESDLMNSAKNIWNVPYSIEDDQGMTPNVYIVFMQKVRRSIRLLILKDYSRQFIGLYERNKYPFVKDGYSWFLKFDNKFNDQKGVSIKYTMIFEFLLLKKLIIDNFEQYRLFVIDNCENKLGDTKFSRRGDTSEKSNSNLIEIYRSK